ncbi:hypothetical protein BTE48_11860 [Oceanospirillum multiglobuliferum]|uniref:Uncharacterized protein n=1 Tax=Oceanospirillum multiglobuliferum TaxID=64969 RepID=A0A1V4T4P8_9GAMM|nr:hypothetical protein BTE48_11860 [Oceanospirillum multiglobuliferum]
MRNDSQLQTLVAWPSYFYFPIQNSIQRFLVWTASYSKQLSNDSFSARLLFLLQGRHIAICFIIFVTNNLLCISSLRLTFHPDLLFLFQGWSSCWVFIVVFPVPTCFFARLLFLFFELNFYCRLLFLFRLER